MSDEEIASIKESTFGVSELLQEAETFVGARQERELMRARERYWHDQNSFAEIMKNRRALETLRFFQWSWKRVL